MSAGVLTASKFSPSLGIPRNADPDWCFLGSANYMAADMLDAFFHVEVSPHR
jgi:hypothetical protein